MRLAEVGDDEEHRRAADGDWHLGVQRREEVMVGWEKWVGPKPTSRFVAGLHAWEQRWSVRRSVGSTVCGFSRRRSKKGIWECPHLTLLGFKSP